MTTNPRIVLSMISSPTKFFENPAEVLDYPGLRRSDRIDILRSWKHDVILLMQAADENMVSDITYSLEDINRALSNEAQNED